MAKRLVTAILLILLLVLQGQLWLGRGSIPNVNQLQQKLDTQKASNIQAKAANERLTSEVSDLKEGVDTVEQKARMELGMVKQGEIYVQIAK
jgi:cell division protein FtsB